MYENQTLTTFYVARHGQTEFNAQNLYQGQVDSPLTELGIAQAKELGERLRHVQFDHVFSSDLGRAKHTAELAKLERDLAVVTTELIRERSFGNYEGRPHESLLHEARHLVEKYEQLTDEEKFTTSIEESMESQDQGASRLVQFLRETAVAYPGKTILVVAHAGILRGMLVKVGFGTIKEFPSGSIDNVAHVQLETDGVDFYLKDTFGVHKKLD